MQPIESRIATANWLAITESLHEKGHAMIPNLLTEAECENLKKDYHATLYRKTIIMERYRFGLGEYKYFTYPLPSFIQTLRETIYPQLAPIANAWMRVLNTNEMFPDTLTELHEKCRLKNQEKPTVLILKYGIGGHNTLHQDLYGDVYFPIQTVLFLSEPERDYTGGEFVLTQQTPRAQSKVIVLKPNQGDMLIFTTHFRPIKGTMGYYRASMKHGVSEVHSGERYTLGIIFHDALS